MFIVIEGLDGCGKSTQLDLLKNNLKNADFITFPYYETNSGKIIKAYLDGEYGEDLNETGAYSASVMYALDRYTSFKTHWQSLYENQNILISARYTSSNAIYQMNKLSKDKWCEYLNWLYDLEYNKLGLPKPDLTIFLDMPIEISQKMLSERYNGDETQKDIHEKNVNFLNDCRLAAYYVANRENWIIIHCAKDNKPRTIMDIQNEIIKIIETHKSMIKNTPIEPKVDPEIEKRRCYDCVNYHEAYFCGYNESRCQIYGSLDMGQTERHPDMTAKTCSDYKRSPFIKSDTEKNNQ